MAGIGGPAQQVLAASVARRYYVDGLSKIAIAAEYDLSRFQVARLLQRARASGMVRIDIGSRGALDLDRSSQLQAAYRLRHAIVLDVDDGRPAVLGQQLGEAAAALLSEVLTAGDVLGLAGAPALSALAGALTRLPALSVVQLTGVPFHPESTESPSAAVREVARSSGGRAYFFAAPLLVADAAAARAQRRQPEVARAFDRFPAVTVAVVGIGLFRAGQSALYDALDEPEQRWLSRVGACAEVSGVLLDADGHAVPELTDRVLGMSAAQLRTVPEVLAVTDGAATAPAVRAALSGGLVNGLVTHAALADALLATR
ncbi:MAG: transcriptional regulator, DeoR family [Frankiales bacterium]|nr:transcriptional regulator, DeoR family [Frankiales bacterium]